ncbi:MAG: disulfide bond formation protein B [Novosphingobium sp.]|nr:disulfide bond formation protein B [Novosphingobium sp.]
MQAQRSVRLLAVATPLILLGGAYLAEYGFGLFPCEMCWWQRYAHFAALAFAVAALLCPRGTMLLWLSAAAIAVSGLIGGYHAGVEYGWWQGVTSCSALPASGSDPLEAILAAPLVRCDVAPWTLFGISLAGWNFAFSLGAALAIALLLSRGRRATS